MRLVGHRRSTLGAVILATGWPTLALAHSLLVFATVDGDEVVVEAKFSNGRPVQAGEVRVLDAEGAVVHRLDISGADPIRLPIGTEAAGGLTIEVSAGEGHESYWVLTPGDIEAARFGAVRE